MKLLIIVMVCIGLRMPVLAQTSLDSVITLSQRTITVKAVLDELDTLTSYTFSYSNRLPLDTIITFPQTSGKLRTLLDYIRQQQRIEYRVVDHKILFFRRRETGQRPDRVTLSGYLTDAATGERLSGATVYVPELSAGMSTNAYGYYAMSIPPGDYTLRFSFVGYQSENLPMLLEESQTLNIALSTQEVELETVVVRATGTVPSVEEKEISTAHIDIQTIRKMPSLLGEVDVLRSIQLLPGVTSVGGGASGFNVRGGNADQNLVLLDEAPVFSASHLLGIFSVFNPDAIKDVKLYKGGIPARYGGRLSSVLDVRQKEGNTQRFGMRGGIGLIGSRLLIEGPLVKDKSSFMLAGRRSYGDLLYRTLGGRDATLYFYDLNAKANYEINDRNRLYLSGYLGRDAFGIGDFLGFDWGNRTATLRWNHLFSDKLFSNVTAVYSDYQYRLNFFNSIVGSGGESADWNSRITNYHLQTDLTYFLSANSSIDFGASAILYQFDPGRIDIRIGVINAVQQLEHKQAVESAIYATHKKQWDKLTLQYGLRYSTFLNVGQGNVFRYENNEPSPDNDIIDTISYRTGEVIQWYDGLEPRLSLNYSLNKSTALKASYNRLFQYIQLVSNTTTPTPIDIWTPASQYIRPAVVNQVALGFFHNFRQNTIAFSAEAYYKRFQDLIDFRGGAELILNETLERDLLLGQGRAYGVELMLRKQRGRVSGWVSYTWSRTERQVDGISNDAYYPANYDKPHDVSVVLNCQLTKKWSASANFAYATGRPLTAPTGQFTYEGNIVPDYTNRNGARMVNYHRLDLSLNYEPPVRADRRWRNSWSLGIYNVYARRNPYSVFFRPKEEDPTQTEAVQLSILGFIPSITYNFTF